MQVIELAQDLNTDRVQVIELAQDLNIDRVQVIELAQDLNTDRVQVIELAQDLNTETKHYYLHTKNKGANCCRQVSFVGPVTQNSY